jgi:hypothetical protein
MKLSLKKKEKVPTILSEKDAKILGEYKRRVEMFDQMFKLCCCWVGWDMLLGKKLKDHTTWRDTCVCERVCMCIVDKCTVWRK